MVVIDGDHDAKLAQFVEGWGVRQIHQSAHLGDALERAGISRASAVVCAESNDLATLEIALRVREIRPDVRLVIELANPSVGRALERVTGPNSVLDVAALAAPSFVEACLGLATHEMEIGGEQTRFNRWKVSERAGFNQTFRSYFGNLAPVAVAPANGDAIVVCPGRDQAITPGDRVAILGTERDFEHSDIDVVRAAHFVPPSVPPHLILRRRLAALMKTNAKGLVISLSSLVVLLVLATLVIHFAYIDTRSHRHLDLLSSTYFTVETVATVGFGDYYFAGQRAWVEGFSIVLIILGVTLVSTSFALFTNILVSRRIEQSLGRRRVPGMAGHIVVVGLGSVGIRVVESLVAVGRQVVVIERDDSNRYLERARALKVPVVIGMQHNDRSTRR